MEEEEIEESLQEFPGLYTTDQNYKHDSDSNSPVEKTSKKELLKKKKERNKDIGYSALDTDSSSEEMDLFDSRKVKKTKSFKFLQKKDRDEKEERKKERKKEKEFRKREKEEKRRIKKDKKKRPNYDEGYFPIFGVPLAQAVERCPSHDGIKLPAIIRECIDFIEENGLSCEGIYRVGGIKSKIQSLRHSYNVGEEVTLRDQHPHVVASLLKQYLRELPETVLTVDMMPHFEDVALIPNPRERAETMRQLIDRLPTPNRLLLQYMLKHMGNVVEKEKESKISYQNICVVLSPLMQISHRVLNVMFHSHQYLFGDVVIKRYIPPITSYSQNQRSIDEIRSPHLIEEELIKQESLLACLHTAVALGRITRSTEEQLWEAQRNHTLLKRKLKLCDKKEGDCASNEGSESSQEKLSILAESQKELQLSDSKGARLNEAEVRPQRKGPVREGGENTCLEPIPSEKATLNGSFTQLQNGRGAANDMSSIKDVLIPVLPKPVSVRAIRRKLSQDDRDAVSQNGVALDVAGDETEVLSSVENTPGVPVVELSQEISSQVRTVTVESDQADKHNQDYSPKSSAAASIDYYHSKRNASAGSRGKSSDYSILLREGLRLQFEHEELLCMNHELTRKLKAEKAEISKLRDEIQEMQTLYGYRTHSYDSSESEGTDSEGESDTEEDILQQIASLDIMNDQVESENALLIKKIKEEREAVIQMRVALKEIKSKANCTFPPLRCGTQS